MGRDLFPGSNNGVSVVATNGQYKQASIFNSPVAPTNTTTPAFSYDGRVGWIGSYPSGTAYPTWGLANTGFNAGVTFACMGIANATSSGVPYALVMNGTPGASGANWPTLAITAVGGANSGLVMLITSTTYTYGGFPFTNGRPYFWAVSHLVGTSKINLVQRDLITGQAWSLAATAFTSGSGPMTTPSGNINILGNANGGWGNNGSMLAAAAYVGGYHALPELLRWADAPWDFWYPRQLATEIVFPGFQSLGPTLTLAYTEAPDTVSITGSDSGPLAYTEAPDTVAIAGTMGNPATLAYGEDPDTVLMTAAVSGVLSVTEAGDVMSSSGSGYTQAALAFTDPPDIIGSMSNVVPYWHGPPALWPYRIDFTGPVIYVRAAIQVTGPACTGFRIADIYFRRRALNYLDNIPDNPGAITVPCFAAATTNYATLAYTEPPDVIGIGVVLETFTVPSNWNNANNSIECIGGGGGGNSGWGPAGGGGGAGGGYSIATNVTLTPGASIPLQIGQGGLGAVNTTLTFGGQGTSTIFDTVHNTVVAGGGKNHPTGGVGNAPELGGIGGTGTHAGGPGGDFSYPGIYNSCGSGGGGAGGPHGPGAAGGIGAYSAGGGGGGAADSGGAGANASTMTGIGGAGGVAQDGTPGGVGGAVSNPGGAGGAGAHGSGGGGGGYSGGLSTGGGGRGGAGGAGIIWTATAGGTAGPGGGGGGGGLVNSASYGSYFAPAGNGGLYGGGGGSGPGGTAAPGQLPGNGAQGCIVITMTPVSSMTPVVWIFT